MPVQKRLHWETHRARNFSLRQYKKWAIRWYSVACTPG